MKRDFFISYTSRDWDWAEWTAWTLEEAGFETFIQAWDTLPGSSFAQQMRLAAKECSVTVALLSRAYLESVFADPEWDAGFRDDSGARKRDVLPVRIEECELGAFDTPIGPVNLAGRCARAAADALLRAADSRLGKESHRRDSSPTYKAEPPFPGSAARGDQGHRPCVGIISTEFIQLDARKRLTYEANELQRELGLSGAVVLLLDPTLVALGIRDGRPVVGYVSPRSEPLPRVNWGFFAALDLLLIRKTRASDRTVGEAIYHLLHYLNAIHPNLILIDPLTGFTYCPLSKIPSLLDRARVGLPQGDRVLVARSMAARIGLPFEYPIVAKPTVGSLGQGVVECANESELAGYLVPREPSETYGEFSVMLEDHLQPREEFRVVVVGNEPVGCVRKQAAPRQLAANYAMGAAWGNAPDDGAGRLAVDATRACGLVFAGVDVVRKRTGYVVIECNRNPQFQAFDRASGVSVARSVARYALGRIEQK